MFAAGPDMDVDLSSESQNAVAQVTVGQVRFAAMSLLARREHSRYELHQKLTQRFPGSSLVDQVVQQLADEALQCDRRFAECFVATRVRKGQGPVRIEKELQQRRVEPEYIAQAMEAYNSQWAELAYAVWKKKYGIAADRSPRERAKQMRFLQYRGFTHDHIQSLCNQT